jgi:hypothetical protein
MRPVRWVLAFPLCALACSGGTTGKGKFPDGTGGQSDLADEDHFVPGYGKPEIQRTLIAERGLEATAERVVNDLEAKPDRDIAADDRLRIARADLAVRRRFIKALEACEANGRWCPPRLDDPSFTFDPDGETPLLDSPLKFDIDGWRKVGSELHGRACACRTLACLDSVDSATNVLEARAPASVQGDEPSSLSLTRARECLFRLRGRDARPMRPIAGE